LLNLMTPDAVSDGFETVVKNVNRAQPDARILGVQVQQMAPAGQEVIVGTVQDLQFGALLMFGSGGVEVEGLRDVVFSLAPLSEQDAESLLKHSWAGRKLDGYRNISAVDKGAALDVLYRVGQLAADHPELAEIEINPLRVTTQGVIAIDTRIRLG